MRTRVKILEFPLTTLALFLQNVRNGIVKTIDGLPAEFEFSSVVYNQDTDSLRFLVSSPDFPVVEPGFVIDRLTITVSLMDPEASPAGAPPAPALGKSLEEMTYEEYLQSPHWLTIRALKLHTDPICERCGASASEVHHKNYDTLGMERWSDIESLCRDCHEKHHNVYRGVPRYSNRFPAWAEKLYGEDWQATQDLQRIEDKFVAFAIEQDRLERMMRMGKKKPNSKKCHYYGEAILNDYVCGRACLFGD